MPTPAKVVVVPTGHQSLVIEEVELPDPRPHQVVVREHASGICHSQLHEIHRPREVDAVLGHEATGTVVGVGGDVHHVTPGDRVFVTWLPRAGEIRDGRDAEAAELTLADGRPARSQGVFTWADHTIVDEQYVVPMDPALPTEPTAIIGCAVMTGAGAVVNTAGVRPGESVAVFGAGGIGLCAIAAAKVVGADPVIAVDIADDKLDMARRHGATHGVNAATVDPVAEIHALTPGQGRTILGAEVSGVDYAFDCIGGEPTELVLAAARTKAVGATQRGTAVLVGIPRGPIQVDPMDLLAHEKRLIGSIGGSSIPERDFPTMCDWYRRGDLDLDAIVTRRFALDEINEAVDALSAGRIAGRAVLVYDD